MSWNELWNQVINVYPGIAQICLRLACAMLVGLVIGTEREYTHRPAGMRTHILVALGACVVSITGEMLFHYYSVLGSSADPARLSAQVISGVSFLGAGTIMKEGTTVKGLTTAASVWSVACLGLAAGYGYYALALLGMVFIFVTLTIFEALQNKLIHVSSSKVSFTLETADLAGALARIHETAGQQQITVYDLTAEQAGDGFRILFRVRFDGRRSRRHSEQFFDALAASPECRSLRYSDNSVNAAV